MGERAGFVGRRGSPNNAGEFVAGSAVWPVHRVVKGYGRAALARSKKPWS
jgi:hypothetical protein